MRTRFISLMLALLPVLWACSDDNEKLPGEASITVDTPETDLLMEADKNAVLTIDFHSTHNWRADSQDEWLAISPKSGKSGDQTIKVIAKERNLTGDERSARVTLTADGTEQTVTIRQKSTPVLEVEQTWYSIPAEGQDVTIRFTTSYVDENANLMVYSDVSDWIVGKKDADLNTKALVDDSYVLTVMPNDTRDERSGEFQIYIVEKGNPDNILMTSPHIVITQSGQEVGTSADLTTHDKQVVKLQTHTEGQGIPVVLMGDGFIDTEISGGFYREVMERTMENLFTEEPVRSLRPYFDVWMVTAVSLNNAFHDDCSTRFDCVLEGGTSTGIIGNNERVQEYVKAIPELAGNPALFDETLTVVILNTQTYAETTSISYPSTARPDAISEFAIAYCPIVDGLDSERFRQVLVHEGMGHGFGKLLDEYSYEQNGTITPYYVETYRSMQEMGWAMNIDFTDDPAAVLWNRFLADPRYQGPDAFGQELGLYEGACTYWEGVWRSTDDSMMRNNQYGFNAPSREALYKRVMNTAWGYDWTYDYETFVAFDQAHLPQPAATRAVAGQTETKPLPAPQIVARPQGMAHSRDRRP